MRPSKMRKDWNKVMSKTEKIEGIVIICIGILVVILSFKLGGFSLNEANQAMGLFPIILGFVLIGCGIKLSLEGKKDETKRMKWPERPQMIRVLFVFLAMLANVPAVEIFGYLVGTGIIFGIQCWLLGEQRFWRICICAAILSFVSFFIFQKVLYIDLPDGFIPKMLGVN
jgi:preprotein translocase subunit SecE